jgi:hypothetical protein
MTGRSAGIGGRAVARRFCADISRENDEPLGATASRIDHWFLVEYRGVWARDALPGSGLTDQVKQHLRDQVAAVPHGRLLFVRRPDRRREPTLLAYSASSRPNEKELRRTELETYEDLRRLDLRAGDPVDHPLFVACTHGKHDPCCARYGRRLYEALRDELEPEWVWQSSHIGGDRFAGNLVCLPEGLYYGRVDRDAACLVLDEHLAGRIDLEHYRGRSIYTFAVQAAERWVREQTDLVGIEEVTLTHAERRGGSVDVVFSAGGQTYDLHVDREPGELTLLTCNSDSLQRPSRYVVSPA